MSTARRGRDGEIVIYKNGAPPATAICIKKMETRLFTGNGTWHSSAHWHSPSIKKEAEAVTAGRLTLCVGGEDFEHEVVSFRNDGEG